MLIFNLYQRDLSKALNICNQISPKRSDIDLFTYTKVEIDPKNQSLKLTAINSTLAYSTRLVINLDNNNDEVAFLIKTEMLASAVNLLNNEQLELSLSLDKKTLIIQGEKSKHTLRVNTDYVNDFLINQEKPENLEIITKVPTTEFFNAIKSALVSVGDRNSHDPMFKNVCLSLFSKEKKIQVVSTDRYRITKTVVGAEFSDINDKYKEKEQELERVNYLIDPKSLQLLMVANNEYENQELNLKFESEFLWVQFDNTSQSQLVLRYGDGNYPDYEKIIPQSFACNFEVNTTEIVSAIKQVYLSAKANTDNKSLTINIKPSQQQMLVSAQTANGEASESLLTIYNYAGQEEEWQQSFNADYLLGYLNTISTSQVLWESNPGRPSVLSPFGEKQRQIYLISGLK